MSAIFLLLVFVAVNVHALWEDDCEVDEYYGTIDIEQMISDLDSGAVQVDDAIATLQEFLAAEHVVVPYTDSYRTDCWDALQILDADPSNASNVILIYAQASVPGNDYGTSSTWNREHVWPKSLGVGYTGADFSDLHSLRAADWSVNSARNNLYYDNCDGCDHAHDEAYADAAKNSYSFRPPSMVKGDLARSIFYMAVRYHGGDEMLKISDCPCQYSSTMGVLTSLLQWHDEDPPSDKEIYRTSMVCSSYQKNRNPFIDYPRLAQSVFENANYSSLILNKSSVDEGCLGDGTDMDVYCVDTSIDVVPTEAPTIIYNYTTPCADTRSLGIVGFNSDSPKQIAIVVLSALEAGDQFLITDNAWNGAENGWRDTEGVLRYTTPSGGHPVGAVIVWNDDDTSEAWESISGKFNPSASGDSFIIYKETEAGASDPCFFYGLIYSPGGWSAESVTEATTSMRPTSLASKHDVVLSHGDNYVFDQGDHASTISDILDRLCKEVNWIMSNSNARNLTEYFGGQFNILATDAPTASPTVLPTTSPTISPTTNTPTSDAPTASPTNLPTPKPTNTLTTSSTESPSSSPTESPTDSPSTSPTESPTSSPTDSPTASPTKSPSAGPTKSPTSSPTVSPTASPSKLPTANPTTSPSIDPTESPTSSPTDSPTASPTESPSAGPTELPSSSPTDSPTTNPTKSPTANPTDSPMTDSPTSTLMSNPTENKIQANLVFAGNFDANVHSVENKELCKELCDSLTEGLGSVLLCQVLDIRKGSIVFDVHIEFSKAAPSAEVVQETYSPPASLEEQVGALQSIQVLRVSKTSPATILGISAGGTFLIVAGVLLLRNAKQKRKKVYLES